MKVSICMITYNHESFIKKAIEGVLMQVTDFDIELLISNDCSPDNTHKVIEEVRNNHAKKHLINYINHETNVGMMTNFISTLQACTGDFVCVCEGDDYWTDPLKLQKQVAVLQENQDCHICFTDNSKLLPDGNISPAISKNIAVKTNFEDLIQGNFIANLTMMYRQTDLSSIPDYFYQFKIGDWPLFLWLLNKTNNKVYYLKEDTAMYRVGVGVSKDIREHALKEYNILETILQAFYNDSEFSSNKVIIKKAISGLSEKVMGFHNRNKSYSKALKILINQFIKKPSFRLVKLYLYSLQKGLS